MYDKMDMQLPDVGLLQVEDAETETTKWIDTSSAVVRKHYSDHFMKQSELNKSYFKKAGADLLHIRTDEDYIKILQQFFHNRK
jgi:hypothetical protein